jgi:ADP-dependent NAD(P)H-hydrate dehydratase / NAD(P)H-hydrate epimerase
MVLTADQVRAWDEYTITHEPVSSLQLMERAALRCVQWLQHHKYLPGSFSIFCGKGNNGGDGLAIARMLSEQGCEVNVHILEFGHKGTDDFQQNLAMLHGLPVNIRFIQADTPLPPISSSDIIIDALLGSGLNRPLEGITAALVEHLNVSGNTIIAIDIPSGLFVDKSAKGNTVIKAHHTLSFECYKPALLVAENEAYTGKVHILAIGLHAGFIEKNPPAHYLIDERLVKNTYKPRKQFSHKGTFGHALLVAGSSGKMGAAILAAKACLRGGVGLLTMLVPHEHVPIMQTVVPEAMCLIDEPVDYTKYNAIGLGPGLGQHKKIASWLESQLALMQEPIVLDADALNIISAEQHLLSALPPYSILTPHPKEFERLFGKAGNDFERLRIAQDKAKAHNIIIVLKGRHTFIATPAGKSYFNSTGNAGMATGGTGDVLTGIITALIAQGYTPEEAAVFGVWWHGAAGDIASNYYSQESLIASDIPEALGPALKRVSAHVDA